MKIEEINWSASDYANELNFHNKRMKISEK